MFFQSNIRKIFKRKKSYRAHLRELNQEFLSFKDLYLFETSKNEKNNHLNPLNHFGAKCFSQSDEDGITLEILKRIGILENGSFAEFGVADGTENLTLVLISLGWRGFWVGGDQLAYRTPNNEKFNYIQKWITKDNILSITTEAKKQLQLQEIDVISLDLDGNDIHFVRELLNHDIHPKLFIVEYNAKFIPPLEFEIPYDAQHQWLGDDYFGASLASFVKLFKANDYRLICCNSATGANAFFIKNSYSDLFPEVPIEILALYSPPRYYLPKKFGHPQSTKTLEALFLRK
jgi:hypothetical protein